LLFTSIQNEEEKKKGEGKQRFVYDKYSAAAAFGLLFSVPFHPFSLLRVPFDARGSFR
jgi:hypothetical protein